MTEKKNQQKAFEPITFWLGNPNLQLRIKNGGGYIKFRNGKYTAKTQREADLIAATGIAYEQDMTKPRKPHPVTGYAPMSTEAYDEHIGLIPVSN